MQAAGPERWTVLGSGSAGMTWGTWCWTSAGRRPDQQHESGDGHHDGEHPKDHRIDRLQVDWPEVSGVDLQQPKGIDVLLQQQAVEGTGPGRKQQRCCGDRHQPAVQTSSLALLIAVGLPRHCLRIC